MSDIHEPSDRKAIPPPPSRRRMRTSIAAGAAIILVAAGAALGAGGTRIAQRWQPQNVVLMQPAPINSMTERGPVAIKGEVAEIFGNKFILQDGSGRALVDTGPRGEYKSAADQGETLTVQGRFDRGIVHAEIVTHADGRTEGFGPPPPPPPRGPKGGPGPRADRGPPPPADGPTPDRDAPPPPVR